MSQKEKIKKKSLFFSPSSNTGFTSKSISHLLSGPKTIVNVGLTPQDGITGKDVVQPYSVAIQNPYANDIICSEVMHEDVSLEVEVVAKT